VSTPPLSFEVPIPLPANSAYSSLRRPLPPASLPTSRGLLRRLFFRLGNEHPGGALWSPNGCSSSAELELISLPQILSLCCVSVFFVPRPLSFLSSCRQPKVMLPCLSFPAQVRPLVFRIDIFFLHVTAFSRSFPLQPPNGD